MIYLLCGRVGSGKSTFARQRLACPCLSCDELLLRLFPPYLGEKHGEIQGKCMAYLMDLAVDLGKNGVDVALDFGFWTRQGREEAKEFFARRGLAACLYFLPDAASLLACITSTCPSARASKGCRPATRPFATAK